MGAHVSYCSMPDEAAVAAGSEATLHACKYPCVGCQHCCQSSARRESYQCPEVDNLRGPIAADAIVGLTSAGPTRRDGALCRVAASRPCTQPPSMPSVPKQ